MRSRTLCPLVCSQVFTRYQDLFCSFNPWPQSIESPRTSMLNSPGARGGSPSGQPAWGAGHLARSVLSRAGIVCVSRGPSALSDVP